MKNCGCQTIGNGADFGDIFASSAINGYARGHFAPKYRDTTHIDIGAGAYETDGKIVTLSADATNIEITSIPAGFDLIYIYLNKSASGPTSPVFYNDTAEAVEDKARGGWYHPTNINDRLVDPIVTGSGGATLEYFSTAALSGKAIEYTYGRSSLLQMGTLMNPSGSWQTPNTNDGSAVTPVNAVAINLFLYNSDFSPGNVEIYGANSEMAAVNTLVINGQIDVLGYRELIANAWMSLGASRNIKVSGNNADDNSLSIFCMGFITSRTNK